MTSLPRPFLDWLAANNIDVDNTPMWPILVIDDEAGVIHIEQIWRQPPEPGAEEDGHRQEWPDGVPVIVGNSAGRLMREYPLVTPMSADLASAWELMFEDARRDQALRDFCNAMRGERVGLVMVRSGQRLLLCMPSQIGQDAARAFIGQLNDLLPGIPVSIASGVSAVVTVHD